MAYENFTIERRERFLAALMETCNVTRACEAAGVSRMTVYLHRKDDEQFAEQWTDALKIGAESLEAEAVRRAFEGYDKPIYHQGICVDTVREYSDSLMTLLLKGALPDKYRERASFEHSGPGGGPIETKVDHEHRGKLLADLTGRIGQLARAAEPDMAAASGSATDGVPE